ncbi:MAG: hypothetical protein AAF518_22910 [Spirochaetota bacterium]
MLVLKQDRNGVEKPDMMEFIGILCSEGKRLLKRPTSYEFKTADAYKDKILSVIATRISNKEMTIILVQKSQEIKELRETFLDNIYAGGFSMNYYSLEKNKVLEFWKDFF